MFHAGAYLPINHNKAAKVESRELAPQLCMQKDQEDLA